MIPLPDTGFCGINESRWLLLCLLLQGDRNSMKTALTFCLVLCRGTEFDAEESNLPRKDVSMA